MRKQFKIKRRCCALCKPHKRGWASRWTPHHLQRWREAARQIEFAMQ